MKITPHINPELLKKFQEAHTSEEVPEFDCRKSLLFCCFRNPDKNYDLFYQVLRFTETDLMAISDPMPYQNSSLSVKLMGNSPLQIGVDSLHPWERLEAWDKGITINVFPVSLLSSPVALLLRPQFDTRVSPDLLYESQIPLLGGLVGKCLLGEIQKAFSVEGLLSIKNEEGLILAFLECVIKWIMPQRVLIESNYSSSLSRNAIYCAAFGHSEYSFTLKLSTSEIKTDVEFFMPSFHYPVFDHPFTLVHEVHHLRWRKFKYIQYLEDMFAGICKNWVDLQQALVDARDQKVLLVKNEIDNVFDKYGVPSIGTSNVSPGTLSDRKENCFSRINKNWEIKVRGKKVSPKIDSPQGMEIIRLMLAQENEQLSVYDLDVLLRNDGFTYKRDHDLQVIDSEFEEDQKQVLLEDLASMKKEKNISGKPVKEQIAFWQYRIALVGELFKYGRKKSLLQDWRVAKNELDKLALHNTDENFTNPYSDIVKENKTAKSVKNRRDNFAQNIRKAIKQISLQDEAFALYLTETLVFRRHNEYQPFIFVPDLNTNPKFKNIFWDTDDE